MKILTFLLLSVALLVSAAAQGATTPTPNLAATAAPGQQVQITVTLGGGTPPFNYQWRKNGVNIAVGLNSGVTTLTNTFTLSNVSMADAAVYDCVVSNSLGSVTSSSAALTVGAAPSTAILSLKVVTPTVTGS